MSSIDLSICIVNWNSQNFLIGCLKSIEKDQSAIKYEIIVVDNDSIDNSVQQVKNHFPNVQLILRDRNEGFSKGNNLAIRKSLGRYILLINPDTLLNLKVLEAMVNFMDVNKKIGVCGCRLVHPETGLVESSARSFPTLLPLLCNLSYFDRLFPSSTFFNKYRMTYNSNEEIRKVDWVTGACFLVRREVITKVGGLDENIFMYCEDIEWCYRIKQAGWQIYYYPKVEIAHYRGQSSKLRRENHEYSLSVWGAQQYTYSILYFYTKHYGKRKTLLLRLVIIATSLLKAMLWIAGGLILNKWREGWGRARSYLSMIPVALSLKNKLRD